MKSIRAQVLEAEQSAALGPGDDERFSGYGVMGLSFNCLLYTSDAPTILLV